MFIPKKIVSGYNERNDTYTGKLAYIIYYDEKGKLRKQTSWDSWRKESLGKDEYDNIPTEGFVLNKKVGGKGWSSWDTRNTYTRVYDPRGFEFEISIPNLLFILENTNSIKGKGLEGAFVYGWEGKELWLIPTDAVEYKEWTSLSSTLHNNETVKAKDLVPGRTYLTKQEEKWIYLGHFTDYDTYRERDNKPFVKKYWFFPLEKTREVNKSTWYRYWILGNCYVDTITSVPSKIISCIDDIVHPEYADIMEALEHKQSFVGLETYDKYSPYPTKEFAEEVKETNGWRGTTFYTEDGEEVKIRKNSGDGAYARIIEVKRNMWGPDTEVLKPYKTIADILLDFKPHYQNTYLKANNKICSTSRSRKITIEEIIQEEKGYE